jgi:sulfatase modifying factor 1
MNRLVASVLGAVGVSACALVYPLDGYEGTSADGVVPDGEAGVPKEAFDASTGPCPAGMVRAGGFCIDAREVTQAQYDAFLASQAKPALPAVCGFNTTFEPGKVEGPEAFRCAPGDADFAPKTTPNRPVVCVDFCDAFAFCSARGARLCGQIGGGSADFAGVDIPTASQWFEACSRGGTKAYPYGDAFDVGACQAATQQSADVGSKATCEGGYPGLFDMTGNVEEWEDACVGTGADTACARRGGEYGDDTFDALACKRKNSAKTPSFQSTHLGFRCCAD